MQATNRPRPASHQIETTYVEHGLICATLLTQHDCPPPPHPKLTFVVPHHIYPPSFQFPSTPPASDLSLPPGSFFLSSPTNTGSLQRLVGLLLPRLIRATARRSPRSFVLARADNHQLVTSKRETTASIKPRNGRLVLVPPPSGTLRRKNKGKFSVSVSFAR
jgi:hypothetical protein